MFVLFNFCISLALRILSAFFAQVTHDGQPTTISKILLFISIAYHLIVLLPLLAVAVRRFHDIGQPGGMIFIVLIPLIGGIWFILALAAPPDEGNNEYGPNPINIESETSLEISYD